MADDKKTKANIEALVEFRLKGKAVPKGAVIAKSDFPKKSDWMNLCNMDPKPRAAETDKPVGVPKAEKAGLPGAGGK